MGLHEAAFVFDGLHGSRLTTEHATRTLPAAGVDAVHSSIVGPGDDLTTARRAAMDVQQRIDGWSNVSLVRDATALDDDGGLRVVMGMQDSTPLGDDPERVQTVRSFGVRVVQLTFNGRNRCGCGCTVATDTGLTGFGRAVVEAIEAERLVLDLSHAGTATALDALDAASRPTILSHSNPRAVHDHPRNVPDEVIEAVARTGGTVGVNAFPDFVGPEPTLETVLDHVEYLVDLVGPEHVALGLDFIEGRSASEPGAFADNPSYSDPPYSYPEGLASTPEIPNLTRGLVARGYGRATVEGIIGGNLRRVFRQVLD